MSLLNNLLQIDKNYNQMDNDTPSKDESCFLCTKLSKKAYVLKFALVI